MPGWKVRLKSPFMQQGLSGEVLSWFARAAKRSIDLDLYMLHQKMQSHTIEAKKQTSVCAALIF